MVNTLKTFESRVFNYQELSIRILTKKVTTLRLQIVAAQQSIQLICPPRTSPQLIETFIASKAHWIRKHLKAIAQQKCCLPPSYAPGSLHLWKGSLYPLMYQFVPDVKTQLDFTDQKFQLLCPSPPSEMATQLLFEQWYRLQLRHCLEPLIRNWQPCIGEPLSEWRIKRMKTRWGTCNTRASRIWFNVHLIQTPEECIETVVVHELVHLLEASHNARFKSLMQRYLPDWKAREKRLKEYRLA
jgi:predicted metal-dependent hydrolase